MQAWKQTQAVQIGRNLRERRKHLGLTQSDLAKGLFSTQSISLIERGKLMVAPETLSTLAERLDCQVDDLLAMHDLHEDWLDEVLQTGLRHQEQNQIPQAIEVFHSLYTDALARINAKYLLKSARHLCELYNRTGKYSVSIEWGEEALRYFEPHQDTDLFLIIKIILGNNYYRIGKMWEAFELLREAELTVDANLNSSVQAGRLYFNMAIIKQMLQNWEGCIWYAERALQILDQRDMINLIGGTHMLIGTAYKNQGRFEKAAYHIERSLRILNQTSDLTSLGRGYHNQGELELATGDLAKARKSFLRSLKIKRQAKDRDSMQNTLRALAKVSMQQGMLDEAAQFLKECLKEANELNNDLQLAITWRHMGDLAMQGGDSEAFVSYYRRAIDQFVRVEYSTDLAEAAEKLGAFYLEQGRELLAVPYLHLATKHYRKLLKHS